MTALDFVKALRLATRTKPMTAMCPTCPDEVLVMTFRWPGAEFYCLACHGHFGFVDPRPQAPSPELDARIAETKARFKVLFPPAGEDGR